MHAVDAVAGAQQTWRAAAAKLARALHKVLAEPDEEEIMQYSPRTDRLESVGLSEEDFDETFHDDEILEDVVFDAQAVDRLEHDDLVQFFASNINPELIKRVSLLPNGVNALVLHFLREAVEPKELPDLDWILRVLLPQLRPSPLLSAVIADLPSASAEAADALRKEIDAALSDGAAAEGDVSRLLHAFAIACSPLKMCPRVIADAAAADERVYLRLLEHAHPEAVQDVTFDNPRRVSAEECSAFLHRLVRLMNSAGHKAVRSIRVHRVADVSLDALLNVPARLSTLELDFVPGAAPLSFFQLGGLAGPNFVRLENLRLHALDVRDEHLGALRELRNLKRLSVTCCPQLVSEPFASLPFLQRLEGLEVKNLNGGGECVENILSVRRTLRELHLGEFQSAASVRRRARILRGQPAVFPHLESVSLHHCEVNFERIVCGGPGDEARHEGGANPHFPALRRLVMESGTWNLAPFAGCPRLETVLFTDGIMAQRPEWIHRLLATARTMPALKDIRIGAPSNPEWGLATEESPLGPKIHIHEAAAGPEDEDEAAAAAGQDAAAAAAVSAAAAVPAQFLTRLRM
eukprot:tig00020909_g15335.t1